MEIYKKIINISSLSLYVYIYIDIFIYTDIYEKRNMKSFSNETLNFFSSESFVSPTFWILPKLHELCESPETL